MAQLHGISQRIDNHTLGVLILDMQEYAVAGRVDVRGSNTAILPSDRMLVAFHEAVGRLQREIFNARLLVLH